MPLEITTLVAFVHISFYISKMKRKSLFYSYKFRHGLDFLSSPIALCLPLLVAIINRPSQKYRTNPRTDYEYINQIMSYARFIFISIFGIKSL